MKNTKAYAIIERRFSQQVQNFNYLPVSDADADTQFWTVKSRLSLASLALDRAPEMTVTTAARSLGDVYRAIRQHLTAEELEQWEALNATLERLADKYEN